jgi:hypothetical protein
MPAGRGPGFPIGQGFGGHPLGRFLVARHGLSRGPSPNGYRFPLGSAPKHIAPIDYGVRTYAPHLYLGVRDGGFMIGLV